MNSITDNKNYIFTKKFNNKSKLVPFNNHKETVGETKYYPASSKEWKNTVYFFNRNQMKNLPVYDKNINKIIKGYFNFYINKNFLFNKYIPRRRRRLSLNKIFVSKAEIKHTNSKAILTVFVYNKERRTLLKKIKKFIKIFSKSNKMPSILLKSFRFFGQRKKSFSPIYQKIRLNSRTYANKVKKNFKLSLRNYLINEGWNKLKIKLFKYKLFKKLLRIRKYKLKLSLNKYKFEEIFLFRLSKLISKFYEDKPRSTNLSRKLEINIINLKSIVSNSDIFTQMLALKLKNRKANIRRKMLFVLNKAYLPEVNTIKERGKLTKSVDFNLLENKYKNLNISSIIGINPNNNLDEILKGLCTNVDSFEKKDVIKIYSNYSGIYETIFKSINYKNMGGMRLEVKGRLTRRKRADRAVFKVFWRGGLRNIDSAYKGLSTVNFLGYRNSNVEYSICTSKRLIGAFAVKGWISGK